jgi:hypothetical protein
MVPSPATCLPSRRRTYWTQNSLPSGSFIRAQYSPPTLWPAIKAHGFATRTDRVAWRYAGDDIDVVELQAVGQSAE